LKTPADLYSLRVAKSKVKGGIGREKRRDLFKNRYTLLKGSYNASVQLAAIQETSNGSGISGWLNSHGLQGERDQALAHPSPSIS